MKRRLLAVFIALIPLSLTSCSLLSWNNLKTPAKFLHVAEEYNSRCWLSIPREGSDYKTCKEPYYSENGSDYNLEIQKALKAAGNFKKTDQSQTEAHRFFIYGIRYDDGFVGLSSGVNCYMAVYEDGFVQLECEIRNKDNKFAYFTMDSTKAYDINDLVYEKIPRDKQTIQEDKTKAFNDGGIDNFTTAMEKKSTIKVSLTEYNYDKTTKANHNLTDDGQLLELIKGAEYTRTNDHAPSDASRVFFYNVNSSQKGELSWYYYLYDSFDYVEIYYSYYNRLNALNNVTISYKIDSAKGKAIIDKALELTNK